MYVCVPRAPGGQKWGPVPVELELQMLVSRMGLDPSLAARATHPEPSLQPLKILSFYLTNSINIGYQGHFGVFIMFWVL